MDFSKFVYVINYSKADITNSFIIFKASWDKKKFPTLRALSWNCFVNKYF